MAAPQIPTNVTMNECGAPDFRAYSDADWVASQLPYCHHCMQNAGYATFDCPHGHIVTPERFEIQVHWWKVRTLGWAAIYTAVMLFLGLWVGAVAGWIILGTIMAFRMHYQGVMRGKFALHPEFLGYWERNKRANQPWVRKVF